VSDESEGSAVPAETRNGLAFRDTYQLSVFRTVQDVLTGVDRPIPTPVVHEIGVNGPVALRMDCEHDHSEGDPDGEGEESESDRGYSTSIARSRLFAAIDAFVPDVLDGLPRSLEPKVVAAATAPRTTSAQNEESLRSPVSAPGQGKLATLRLVGSIVLLAILLALLSKRPRGLETELVRVLRLGAGRRLVLPLLVVVAVLFLMNEISHGFGLPYPEPLELLSGASAWLSVILRVIVLVYCAWAILAIRASLAG
jgi:hypothetical protein